jgi:DNA-binding NarL/FixJ family response regulator
MEQACDDIAALVADRLTFFRHGMIGLLKDCRPGWRLTEAATFDEVVSHLRSAEPDLVLVDLLLPGMNGPDGIRRLRTLCAAQRIVVLAETDDRETILDCLSSGAQGYVLKSATPSQFLQALDTIRSGGVFAPASLTGIPLRAPVSVPAPVPSVDFATQPLMAVLTDRQRDVFRLLAEGCATKTIARRLDLAVGTVKVHLAAIYRVLGAHSRMEAMAKACGGFALSPMMTSAVMPIGERVN